MLLCFWNSFRSYLRLLIVCLAIMICKLSVGVVGAKAQRRTIDAKALSASEIFAQHSAAVLFLECLQNGRVISQASGVLIDPDGHLVTNAHVVEGCSSIKATYVSGKESRLFDTELRTYLPVPDLAILQINAKSPLFMDVLNEALPEIGLRIYAVGNPRGMLQTITEGIVSGIRELDGVPWIQHSAAISPGSSGGALIAADGRLLGITSFLIRDSQNLNFAVPVSSIARALAESREKHDALPFPGPKKDSNASDPLTAYLQRDFIGSINASKVALQDSERKDRPRLYALIAISYCRLGRLEDANLYISQALPELQTDDELRQSTLACAIEVYTGPPNRISERRRQIAEASRTFLASNKHPLFESRPGATAEAVQTVLDFLKDLGGNWRDTTGGLYRLKKSNVVVFDPRQNHKYFFYVQDDEPQTGARRAGSLTGSLVETNGKLSGTFDCFDGWLDENGDSAFVWRQKASILLTLDNDTTTLRGTAIFDKGSFSSKKPFRAWADMFISSMTEGSVSLELVRE